MDATWSPMALDSTRDTQVFVYPDASPRDVLLQFDELTSTDLTTYVASCKQTPNEAQIRLVWHEELSGDNQPVPGQVLEIKVNGKSFWIGIIQAISDYRFETGAKSITLVARTRDASPAWRDVRRVTDEFLLGVEVDTIIRKIAYGLGLSDEELAFSSTGLHIVQSNVQLADLTPWQMFGVLMQPAGLEPMVNLRGQLKSVNRDTTRTADVTLADNTRLLRVGGSKSRPAATEVRVNWLDPNLTRSGQQNQPLTTINMTAGFFTHDVSQVITFSPDRSQRVENSYMVVKHSCNGGLIRVADERYTVLDDYSGKVELITSYWVPTLITGSMATILASSLIPDWVHVGGFIYSTGFTVSVGRLVQAVGQLSLSMIMASIGTGVYEIRGTPYDYVHAKNSTTAYSSRAKPWETQVVEIDNDFVMDQAGSEAFAVRELIYSSRSAFSYQIAIVDDPRIEVGDIVALQDGSGIYVTNYSRDLSFGAPSVLELDGFYIPTVGS